jgi:hypothetical protein
MIVQSSNDCRGANPDAALTGANSIFIGEKLLTTPDIAVAQHRTLLAEMRI